MTARFDDLRPHRRRSFALARPEVVHCASTLPEVADVVSKAEAAVRNGRWVAGFVTYEAGPAFDPALEVSPVDGSSVEELPLAWFAEYDARHAVDDPFDGTYRLGDWVPTISPADHHAAVGTIREHIRQGRTYQVNHTFRLEADFAGDAASLYRDLSRSQTCGYGSFIDTGRWAIASASPELFFEWRDGKLISRPMKGTVRRGTTLADDEDQRQFLFGSEKNRAENLMIVDMVRNDLGRICTTGSVRVPEIFTIEKYDTVWQMTSTVVGTPIPGSTLLDVFGALFPSASITGAPKVATMGIIADLERTPRGVYCGTVGFGGPGPSGPEWAFNVAIRTVLVDRESGRAIYGTGGGITYDSTPGDEFDEALLKTRVLDRRSADLELIETIRWDPGSGFHRLALHLERLSSSSWYFDVPLDTAEVRAALGRAVRRSEHGLVLRLRVDRAGWISVDAAPLPPRPAHPIRLAIDTQPIDPGDPLLYHKTSNRAVYERAADRFPDHDDVVLVGPDGRVTETTIANLAVQVDGQWFTPPLTDGLLPGVERRALIGDGTLRERHITIDDVLAASSLARFNSVRGWEPCVLG